MHMLINTKLTDTTDNESKKTERQLMFYKQKEKAERLQQFILEHRN
mgnify:FL=1